MVQRYISPSGSDTTGNGTSASPWQSILKASQNAVAGDTVNLANGTYVAPQHTTCAGTSANRIVFRATNKWQAVIVPTAADSSDNCWWVDGAYVTIDGIKIDGTTHAGGTRWAIGINARQLSVFVLHCWVHHIYSLNTLPINSSGGAGILLNGFVSGYDNGVVDSCLVHHCGFVGNNFVQGIYVSQVGGIVKNCITHNIGRYAIQLFHDLGNNQVCNNTVFASDAGIVVGADEAYHTTGTVSGIRVHNNIVYSCTTTGLHELQGAQTLGTNFYLNNCIFGNGTNYSMVNGSAVASVTSNPTFVNYVAGGTGDYHLVGGSPCIDTGTSTNAPTTDFDDVARPKGSGYDIGAYEYVAPVSTLIDPTTPTGQMPNGKTGGYTLVMSDEFNSTTLSTKWKNEHDFADHTASTSWDVHKGGNSLLRMWWNGNTATDNQQFSSTGANPFRQRFGFWEAKVKVISGKGFFPGFWLYPYNNAQQENADGQQHEIDIVEWFSFENGDHLVDTTNYRSKNGKFTVWTDGGGGGTTLQGELYLGGHAGSVHGYDTTLSTTLHTYGLEWTAAGGLTMYFDGVSQGTIADPWGAANNIQLATFLQLWWGGNGGNPVPASPQTTAYTSAPAVGAVGTMDFDYVRVWTIGGGGPPPPPPLVATLITATYADNATITGNANFQIKGDSIQNAELLAGSAGTYTPSYGVFTLGPGSGAAGDTVEGVLNWNTLAISNGPITVHISAFSQPPGSGGSEVVVTERHYIINNVLPPNSVTASAADRDMQFITSELDFVIGRMSKLRTYVKTGK